MPPEPPRTLVGRHAAWVAVGRLLEPQATARLLLVEGEAGVGKSTLLSAAVDAAGAAGWRVHRARPTQAEARFAYAGLADLLDGPLPDLPPVQRHALDVALRRAPTDVPLDQHAVTLATAACLTGPAFVVVDDLPWLDAPTAEVVAGAVRRSTTAVRLLVARRATTPGDLPWELDRHLPPDAVDRLWLGGLAPDHLHELLTARLGGRFSRATTARVHAVSGGNPYYALHLARAQREHGEQAPLPQSLTSFVAARLDAVGPAEREVLRVAATLAVPTVGRLRATLGDGPADAALAAAEAAGLVTVTADGRVGFDHPLVASVVYRQAPPADRRALHRRLAEVEPEAEARARHLALGTVGPDEQVAASLVAAADDARLRGAHGVAAELLGLALARGAGDPGRVAVRLADCQVTLGDAATAVDTLDAVLPDLEPGPLRAQARFLLATAEWFRGRVPAAQEHLRAAADDAHDEPVLLGRIYSRLAIFCYDDTARMLEHSRRAVAALSATTDRDALAGALCQEFYLGVLVGQDPRPELLDRAIALENPAGSPDHSTVPGLWYLALDRSAAARARFTLLLSRDRARGDLTAEQDLFNRLAETELYAGDWPAARAYADAAVRSARLLGDSSADPSVRQRLLLDAFEGRLAEVAPVVQARAADLAADGDDLLAAAYLAVAAFAAASAGDHAAVLRHTGAAARHLASIGIVEPISRLDPMAERLEALALAGSAETADALATVRTRLARIPRPWLHAAWCRASAEHAAARGDLDAAVSFAVPPDGVLPFDRARTLFTRGVMLRRARRGTESAAALDAAGETFTALGAAAWVRRVAAERSRLGLRHSRDEGLTPSEARVARMAAAGATNREVAAALTISPKTVEAHLARVYRKLGIRSRAELGAAVAAGTVPDR
jgi:DNA-binding CsgD family transcriptional regulator